MFFHTAAAWSWVVSLTLTFLVVAVSVQRRNRTRLRPDPTPLPIVGNVLDFPRTHRGREFAALSQKFGDVVYLNVLGEGIVILGSLKAARDLLDKRFSNYSDRLTSVMVQLVGFDWLIALMNYGPRWRQYRRAAHSTMTPDAVAQYQAVQLDAARDFLNIILGSPQDLASHIRFTLTAMAMGTIYGIEIREPQDKYFQMMERMAKVAETILVPGSFPVETFPFLHYPPSWCPGTMNILFDRAKHMTVTDASKRSVVNRILEDSAPKRGQNAEPEQICKEVPATLYVGCCRHGSNAERPNGGILPRYGILLRGAEKGASGTVGTDRLPDFSDRDSLPYVNALVKEVLRWHPAGPINVPHRVVAEDEYNGYLIPGSALVFVTFGLFSATPKFTPSLTTSYCTVSWIRPGTLTFGGETPRTSYSALAVAFEIGLRVGEDGAPVEFKWEAAESNIIAHPKVHRYSIKPRSPHIERPVEIQSAH